MLCTVCGKKVVPTGKNFVLVDGKPMHKKCPTPKQKLSKEESDSYKKLMDGIAYYLKYKPKGYVKDTGLNFKKVINQIKQLKDRGYSYEDQLYTLDKVVEKHDGFYGYTSVVNNIDMIMASKRVTEQQKQRMVQVEQEEVTFDLGKLIYSEEDW
jgi:cysteinyl-tRNA synthetase